MRQKKLWWRKASIGPSLYRRAGRGDVPQQIDNQNKDIHSFFMISACNTFSLGV